MRSPPSAYPIWRLIKDARRLSGLTQQQLADRAGTSQAAIARYERARAMPDVDTLFRIVAAAGKGLRIQLVEVDGHDASLQDDQLRLSPAQRVERNRQLTAVAARAANALAAGRVRPLIDA